ncbi:MAG TPA: collagen-like protein [Myxococcaceae bacterium]|nr:collagen-like protein [Myxococcaceae bacterium]
MAKRTLFLFVFCAALACTGPQGPTGDPGAQGQQGAVGPPGPAGATGANGSLIRWGSDPSQWAFLAGTQGTIALNTTDVLEGDSSFDFTVTSGATGSEYTYGDFVAVDPRQIYAGRVSSNLVTGAGTFSAGVVAYDKNKASLGSVPFVASAATLTQGAWTNFSGLIGGEGTNPGQFPVGTRFVKPWIAMNQGNIGGTRIDALTFGADEISPCFGVLQDSPAAWGNTATTSWSTLISRTFTVDRKVTAIVRMVGHATNTTGAGLQAEIFMDGAHAWPGNQDIGYAVGSIHFWLVNQSWVPVTSMAVFTLSPGTHVVQLRYVNAGGTGTTNLNGVLLTTEFHGCVK